MTSLVTGGAGFIGRHVAEALLVQGHEVLVLDDLSGGRTENVPDQAQLIVGSVLDHELLAKIFEENQIDYIYHLAAYAAEGLSHFIKRFNYQNNVVGSVNLINEAVKHEIKCFVFTSSIAVYGSQTPPMTEAMVPAPEDSYGIAKYAVELELKASKEMFGLDYIIFRPHNVYGAYQNISDPYRNVVGIFMNQLLNGQPLYVFGDGSQTRAFSYVEDVAPIIAASVHHREAYGEVFNIGTDEQIAVNDLAQKVMRAMDLKSEVIHGEQRNEVKHAYASHEKVRRFFELGASTPLEVGLKKMADWARSSPRLATQKFDAIEIKKNLPPFWK